MAYQRPFINSSNSQLELLTLEMMPTELSISHMQKPEYQSYNPFKKKDSRRWESDRSSV